MGVVCERARGLQQGPLAPWKVIISELGSASLAHAPGCTGPARQTAAAEPQSVETGAGRVGSPLSTFLGRVRVGSLPVQSMPAGLW